MNNIKISVFIIIVILFLILISAFFIFSYLKKLDNFPLLSIKITVPEGYTVKDIADKFKRFKNFDRENFLRLAGPKEGYLFPDTYFFTGWETETEVMEKMEENFTRKVGEINKDNLIMASLLEREARKTEDKKIISGILWKRLKSGMLLQVDASLNYINGKTSEEMTKEDLKIDSPYNTYLYKGLPPAPICNPGLESIKAALEPSESQYWYYLSDREGNIHYAKTFEEHKTNKINYLR